MTTQQLEECNKCREAGFPGTMFYWESDPIKKRTDGRPWGHQMNPNGSPHKHKSQQDQSRNQTLDKVQSAYRGSFMTEFRDRIERMKQDLDWFLDNVERG